MIITYYCIAILIIIAYVLGSIPSAVWIGRRYFGIDIREYGSKNAGTTNVLRVLGWKACLPVFAIDFIKGFVAVTLMGFVSYNSEVSPAMIVNLKIVATVAVVLGHIFPMFADFKGGKGVATIVGAIAGVDPTIILLSFGVWVIVFLIWNYVSLASMVAGCSFPLFVLLSSGTAFVRRGDTSVTFIVFSFFVAAMLLWTHRKNIARLKAGTESKINVWGSLKKSDSEEE